MKWIVLSILLLWNSSFKCIQTKHESQTCFFFITCEHICWIIYIPLSSFYRSKTKDKQVYFILMLLEDRGIIVKCLWELCLENMTCLVFGNHNFYSSSNKSIACLFLLFGSGFPTSWIFFHWLPIIILLCFKDQEGHLWLILNSWLLSYSLVSKKGM